MFLRIIQLCLISNFCLCHGYFRAYTDQTDTRVHISNVYTNVSRNFVSKVTDLKENAKQATDGTQFQKPKEKNGARKFSDLSFAEFKELYLSDLKPSVKPANYTKSVPLSQLKKLNIPKKLDWRTYLNYNIISPVKNQKKCGGCWAFSTVETVESMVAKATGRSPPGLSVQQVIDCASNNEGCAGGDTCTALNWMVDSKTPLVTDAEYPLTDESNFCKIEPNATKGIRVKNYKCYKHVREDVVLQLLQDGPLVAAVDATTWNNYQGGIIQYHCNAFLNHAVQIVGYDLSGEVPYYIVRNSWGDNFGHNGYIYIKVGENLCGYPFTIEKSPACKTSGFFWPQETRLRMKKLKIKEMFFALKSTVSCNLYKLSYSALTEWHYSALTEWQSSFSRLKVKVCRRLYRMKYWEPEYTVEPAAPKD